MAYLVFCSRYFSLHQHAKIPEMRQTIHHRNHDRRPQEPSCIGDLRPSFRYFFGVMPKVTLCFYIAIWVRLVTIWRLHVLLVSSPQNRWFWASSTFGGGQWLPGLGAQGSWRGNLRPSLNIFEAIAMRFFAWDFSCFFTVGDRNYQST